MKQRCVARASGAELWVMAHVLRVMFISAVLVWSSSSVAASGFWPSLPPPRSARTREGRILDLAPDITITRPIHRRGGNIQIQGVGEDETYKISLSPLAFVSLFGFLGGWSHALCNHKFDVYTAMVSGHILNMSTCFAEKRWGEALWRLSIIGSYFGGAAGARSIEVHCDSGGAVGSAANPHFKILSPLVAVVFVVAERCRGAQVAVLACGFGLVYPSVSAALGGTITHLLTGHTTNMARLVGARDVRHRGMKTSLCAVGSVVAGAVFGTCLLGALGDGCPYFTALGVLYAVALRLLV